MKNCIVCLALVASCSEPVAPTEPTVAEGPAWFRDVASESGLDFVLVPFAEQRHHFPEIMLGGVGLLDADGDGRLDVYLVQGGDLTGEGPALGNALFRNVGGLRFEDVTEAAGVGDRSYGMGCAAADVNNDGATDLYVTNVGANVLYLNEGAGSFMNVEGSGAADESWSTSAAFFDPDLDGDLDLFVVNYIHWSANNEMICRTLADRRDYCHPLEYRAPAMDSLFLNDGAGRFVDVTASAGIDSALGTGLGVAIEDYDLDGAPDVFVANDMMPNRLWNNLGDGTFADGALLAGCALDGAGQPEAGMGVATFDLEQDGDSDLFLVHLRFQSNTFYRNQGTHFLDHSARLGLVESSLAFTGFGVGFSDFDHDGFEDLFIANGRVKLDRPIVNPARPYEEVNQLYRGGSDGRFAEVLPRGGVSPASRATSRGVAFGDIDDDGDIDLVVANIGGQVELLENLAPDQRAWLGLDVQNEHGSSAIGARVCVTAAGVQRWRTVQPGYGYLTSNDPRLHFGLGDATQAEEVLVYWPGGTQERFGPFAANGRHVIAMGTGR